MDIRESRTYIGDLDIAIGCTGGINNLAGKTLLITGATGTIGSFIVDMLIRYNQVNTPEIIIYAGGRDLEKLYGRYGSCNEVIILPYDLNRPIDFDVAIDYVIHAAGNAHPAAFSSDPVGTIMGNVKGTYELLEYGRTHGCRRLLYVSSGEVYGQGDLVLDEFEETYAGFIDTTLPRSCYPSSKRAAENLCVSYSSQFGLETVIARPCHTYGPEIALTDSRANAQFIRNAVNGEDIVMKSAGTQMRSYNYVADCASAILTVLLKGEPGKAYNIANRNSRITIAGLAGIIAETVGKKVVFEEPNHMDMNNRTPITKQILSSRRIEALGWSGAYTIETGIKHTIDILKGL